MTRICKCGAQIKRPYVHECSDCQKLHRQLKKERHKLVKELRDIMKNRKKKTLLDYMMEVIK